MANPSHGRCPSDEDLEYLLRHVGPEAFGGTGDHVTWLIEQETKRRKRRASTKATACSNCGEGWHGEEPYHCECGIYWPALPASVSAAPEAKDLLPRHVALVFGLPPETPLDTLVALVNRLFALAEVSVPLGALFTMEDVVNRLERRIVDLQEALVVARIGEMREGLKKAWPILVNVWEGKKTQTSEILAVEKVFKRLGEFTLPALPPGKLTPNPSWDWALLFRDHQAWFRDAYSTVDERTRALTRLAWRMADGLPAGTALEEPVLRDMCVQSMMLASSGAAMLADGELLDACRAWFEAEAEKRGPVPQPAMKVPLSPNASPEPTLRVTLSPNANASQEPIPMLLFCPSCGGRHVDDEGAGSPKVHHTHACQQCGMVWRPAVVATVGVQFLPGFKNKEDTR